MGVRPFLLRTGTGAFCPPLYFVPNGSFAMMTSYGCRSVCLKSCGKHLLHVSEKEMERKKK